jgi:hypothetical protein
MNSFFSLRRHYGFDKALFISSAIKDYANDFPLDLHDDAPEELGSGLVKTM